jgi:hypothetical protein
VAGLPLRTSRRIISCCTRIRRRWCAVLGRTRPVIAVGVLEYLPEFWMALSWLREVAGVLDPAEVAVADVARLIVAKEAA